jgi:hypothetical protein
MDNRTNLPRSPRPGLVQNHAPHLPGGTPLYQYAAREDDPDVS